MPARPVDAALYGGDDRTDVDAFTALRTLREDGQLRAAACIAVASDESPPEVSREADATVPGPEGFARVLEALAE
jgi:trehalose 6-phosphate phosphatase